MSLGPRFVGTCAIGVARSCGSHLRLLRRWIWQAVGLAGSLGSWEPRGSYLAPWELAWV